MQQKIAEVKDGPVSPVHDLTLISDCSTQSTKVLNVAARQSWADLSEIPDEPCTETSHAPPVKGILKKPVRTLPQRDEDNPPSIILFWNIRGIGNDNSRNMLREHCRNIRPDWLGIAEPLVRFSSIPASFWRSLGLVFVT